MSTSNTTKSRQSDAQLLKAFVRENDQDTEAAFAEIVRRHQGIVWGVCHRTLSQRCDAEDAFQVTFGLLARKADRIRKPAALGSWLHGVAMKTANRIRQRQQKQRRNTVVLPDDLTGPTPEPFEEIAHKHQIEQIDQQLHSLGDKYRIPIVLFYYLNRTTSQIANELSLTVTAVEGRLKRGRQQLKRGLLRQGTQLSIPISSLGTVAPSAELVHKTTASNSSSSYSQTESACGPSNRQTLLTIPGGTSMFTKATLTAAAALLFTVGSIMHATPGNQRDSELVAVITNSEKTGIEPIEFAAAKTTVPTKVPNFLYIKLEPESMHDRIHAELLELHNQLYNWLTSSTSKPPADVNSSWLEFGLDEIQTDDNGQAFVFGRAIPARLFD